MAAISTLLQSVQAIARAAGDAILEVYADAPHITEKDDRSPLTQADLASHRLILERLQQLDPAIPVLSEESEDVSQRHGWSRFWLVDPLDGTKEFIKRNGEFTVNIALVEHHQAVLGVVHVPVSGVTYLASLTEGAWRQMGNAPAEAIRTQVHQNGPLQVVGSRSHGSDALQAFVAQLGDHEFIAVGSSLKFCLVAEGKAHLYPRLGPTSEWDTAAAQCVVEAAGGRVIDLNGTALRYNARDTLLNPYFLVCADQDRNWLQYLPPDA